MVFDLMISVAPRTAASEIFWFQWEFDSAFGGRFQATNPDLRQLLRQVSASPWITLGLSTSLLWSGEARGILETV
jgi:hypothetical protein